jgi:hypothetical protein
MPTDTTDLYTTVKNTSGSACVFGFLGTHGKRLEDDETYTVPGDLVTKLGSKRSQRQFQALEKALLSGALEIIKSPAVYLLDRDGVGTQVLAKDDRVLGTQEPSTQGGGDFQDNDYNDD